MVKAKYEKQTWEAVAGLNAFDMIQWIEGNIKELPYLLAWLLDYTELIPQPGIQHVRELPPCEYCGRVAGYRCKGQDNQWHDACEACFQIYGQGVGPELGRKLELVKL